MTETLQDVIDRLQHVPENRQDLLAKLVLHEIDEDEKWARSTEAHADALRGLIGDVLQADNRGECQPLDPDRL